MMMKAAVADADALPHIIDEMLTKAASYEEEDSHSHHHHH